MLGREIHQSKLQEYVNLKKKKKAQLRTSKTSPNFKHLRSLARPKVGPGRPALKWLLNVSKGCCPSAEWKLGTKQPRSLIAYILNVGQNTVFLLQFCFIFWSQHWQTHMKVRIVSLSSVFSLGFKQDWVFFTPKLYIQLWRAHLQVGARAGMRNLNRGTKQVTSIARLERRVSNSLFHCSLQRNSKEKPLQFH